MNIQILLTIVLVPLSSAVSAATLTVTSLSDSGPGSLRTAIQTAAAGDVIEFAPGTSGRIDLQSTLTITRDLTIRGNPGVVLDGGGAVRVLNLSASATVELSRLTIRRGFAAGGNGGGILSAARLTLRDCVIENNQATLGGGLFAAGPYWMINSTVDNNSAIGPGGGIYDNATAASGIRDSQIRGNVSNVDGGGIYHDSRSPLSIERSTISGNQSATTVPRQGGGIFSINSPLSIRFSTITSNKAHFGGGVMLRSINASALVTIDETVVAGNTAVSDGGGLFVFGGTAELRNVTLANNLAAAGTGGGLAMQDTNTDPAKATFIHSTIAFNRSNASGGGMVVISGGLVLHASLISDNIAATNPDLQGVFVSRGFNLVRNRGTSSGYLGNDLANGTDPLLNELAFGGGPTLTAALRSGSPAATAVNALICETSAIDQRGYTRPDRNCSIGAFDFNGVAPPAVLFKDGFQF